MRKTSSSIHNRTAKQRSRRFAAVAYLFLFLGVPSYGQIATWSAAPASSDWTYAGNWSPMVVPNSMSAVVNFGATTNSGPMLNPSVASMIEVSSITFLPNAPAYTINVTAGSELEIWGPGITNNSGIIQSFVIPGFIAFFNGATAGSMTSFTNPGSATPGYGGG
jgi:hypothetical protein